MATTFLQYQVATTADLPPLTALRDYIFAANGIFLRSQRAEVAVCLPLPEPRELAAIFGLVPLTPAFHLHVPRIPADLVTTMLALAQTTRLADGRVAEILFYVRWEGEAWHLIVPEQEQHQSAVRPIGTGIADGDDVCLEVHSHHAWAARFSPDDDADEQGYARGYAVLGTIFTRPTIRLRVAFYGHRWEIPASWLLELPEGLTDALLPSAWTQEVTR